ncbi:MAG: cytochrome c [Microscillaceae bacterium]|nr:cytochrome c [Microscillaceae bacterium]
MRQLFGGCMPLFLMFLAACTGGPSSQEAIATTAGKDSEGKMSAPAALSEVAQKGKNIFNMNCSQCHQMNKADLIGPGLSGVRQKYSEEWLRKFILNSQALIASGDAQAKAVYEKYNKVLMPGFNFKEEELVQLLAYLKEGAE